MSFETIIIKNLCIGKSSSLFNYFVFIKQNNGLYHITLDHFSSTWSSQAIISFSDLKYKHLNMSLTVPLSYAKNLHEILIDISNNSFDEQNYSSINQPRVITSHLFDVRSIQFENLNTYYYFKFGCIFDNVECVGRLFIKDSEELQKARTRFINSKKLFIYGCLIIPVQ